MKAVEAWKKRGSHYRKADRFETCWKTLSQCPYQHLEKPESLPDCYGNLRPPRIICMADSPLDCVKAKKKKEEDDADG